MSINTDGKSCSQHSHGVLHHNISDEKISEIFRYAEFHIDVYVKRG